MRDRWRLVSRASRVRDARCARACDGLWRARVILISLSKFVGYGALVDETVRARLTAAMRDVATAKELRGWSEYKE